MSNPKNKPAVPAIPATTDADPFAGLTTDATSAMTVWSEELQMNLDREPSIKFAEGKRSAALQAVYTWAKAQNLNPIISYVVTMGLKTLNRKVGK